MAVVRELPLQSHSLSRIRPRKDKKATIHYHDIGDYLTREQKLKMVKDFRSISSQKLDWQVITPNEKAIG